MTVLLSSLWVVKRCDLLWIAVRPSWFINEIKWDYSASTFFIFCAAKRYKKRGWDENNNWNEYIDNLLCGMNICMPTWSFWIKLLLRYVFWGSNLELWDSWGPFLNRSIVFITIIIFECKFGKCGKHQVKTGEVRGQKGFRQLNYIFMWGFPVMEGFD